MTGASTLCELLIALGILDSAKTPLSSSEVYLRLDLHAGGRIEADLVAVDRIRDAHHHLAGSAHHGPADFSRVARE